ncbi:uncharacterized protein FOMMEDRAFT_164630 [Fomitiporia mediterranea MF3/22]|uniref:uncharacterized protein n=1 Tax=Fomitiporia mediterranea (strain MF3/22) TaxID=694068 RepID=UPI000440919F|nr:uncharacterized protein FOMMEDRAFT_164630 [Fomitiporia mediterranea MF3/22]EJD07748.1 hypothetical protein FOMMEDRAFT_164630 [Fomitiporia mediterranea MF3/22]
MSWQLALIGHSCLSERDKTGSNCVEQGTTRRRARRWKVGAEARKTVEMTDMMITHPPLFSCQIPRLGAMSVMSSRLSLSFISFTAFFVRHIIIPAALPHGRPGVARLHAHENAIHQRYFVYLPILGVRCLARCCEEGQEAFRSGTRYALHPRRANERVVVASFVYVVWMLRSLSPSTFLPTTQTGKQTHLKHVLTSFEFVYPPPSSRSNGICTVVLALASRRNEFRSLVFCPITDPICLAYRGGSRITVTPDNSIQLSLLGLGYFFGIFAGRCDVSDEEDDVEDDAWAFNSLKVELKILACSNWISPTGSLRRRWIPPQLFNRVLCLFALRMWEERGFMPKAACRIPSALCIYLLYSDETDVCGVGDIAGIIFG